MVLSYEQYESLVLTKINPLTGRKLLETSKVYQNLVNEYLKFNDELYVSRLPFGRQRETLKIFISKSNYKFYIVPQLIEYNRDKNIEIYIHIDITDPLFKYYSEIFIFNYHIVKSEPNNLNYVIVSDKLITEKVNLNQMKNNSYYLILDFINKLIYYNTTNKIKNNFKICSAYLLEWKINLNEIKTLFLEVEDNFVINHDHWNNGNIPLTLYLKYKKNNVIVALINNIFENKNRVKEIHLMKGNNLEPKYIFKNLEREGLTEDELINYENYELIIIPVQFTPRTQRKKNIFVNEINYIPPSNILKKGGYGYREAKRRFKIGKNPKHPEYESIYRTF